jgi:hypothetical protein
MIQITPQMRILLAVEPVDFRKGIDGLGRWCREVLKSDPFSGALFVFSNKGRSALRVLVYDGQVFWLCHKRLSSGRAGREELATRACDPLPPSSYKRSLPMAISPASTFQLRGAVSRRKSLRHEGAAPQQNSRGCDGFSRHSRQPLLDNTQALFPGMGCAWRHRLLTGMDRLHGKRESETAQGQAHRSQGARG